MGFSALDILVLLAVAVSALMGVSRGFVAEVLSLFAWVAVVFALKLFHAPVAAVLMPGWWAPCPARRCWRSRWWRARPGLGGRMVAQRARQADPHLRARPGRPGARLRVRRVQGAGTRQPGIPARRAGGRHGRWWADAATACGSPTRAPTRCFDATSRSMARYDRPPPPGPLRARRRRAGGRRPMSAPLYNTELLRFAAGIQHHARLARSARVSAERRSPVCGSRVTVDVNLGRGRAGERGRAAGPRLRAGAGVVGDARGRGAGQIARRTRRRARRR